MANTITYNKTVIASPEGGQAATLKCKGMVMADDVTVNCEAVEEWDGSVRDEQPVTITSSDGFVITDSNELTMTTQEE